MLERFSYYLVRNILKGTQVIIFWQGLQFSIRIEVSAVAILLGKQRSFSVTSTDIFT
jgi:hypothetical protein